jgi:Cu+-exporting ATPase
MIRDTLTISGMTCAACAKRIEKIAGKQKGVINATVNFATEKLTVEYDESVIQIPSIREAVVGIGYEIAEERKKNEVSIPIAGMTCAACAKRLEKPWAKTRGS